MDRALLQTGFASVVMGIPVLRALICLPLLQPHGHLPCDLLPHLLLRLDLHVRSLYALMGLPVVQTENSATKSCMVS